jgi:hypothetical protein
MSEIEVLEIGEDGSFETSTASVKQEKIFINEQDYIFPKENQYNAYNSILSTLSEGEYKLYRDDKYLYIIIHLFPNDSIAYLFLNDGKYIVSTNSKKTYSVQLPKSLTLNEHDSKSTIFEQFLTSRFAVSQIIN